MFEVIRYRLLSYLLEQLICEVLNCFMVELTDFVYLFELSR